MSKEEISIKLNNEPQTQAELDAYVQQSARCEIVWSAVEQHYYPCITVTCFDKRGDVQEQHDEREEQA